MLDYVAIALAFIPAAPLLIVFAACPAVLITAYFISRVGPDRRWLWVPSVAIATALWVALIAWLFFFHNSSTPPLDLEPGALRAPAASGRP